MKSLATIIITQSVDIFKYLTILLFTSILMMLIIGLIINSKNRDLSGYKLAIEDLIFGIPVSITFLFMWLLSIMFFVICISYPITQNYNLLIPTGVLSITIFFETLLFKLFRSSLDEYFLEPIRRIKQLKK